MTSTDQIMSPSSALEKVPQQVLLLTRYLLEHRKITVGPHTVKVYLGDRPRRPKVYLTEHYMAARRGLYIVRRTLAKSLTDDQRTRVTVKGLLLNARK